ncbi:MAG: TonB-dependent receptor [Prevotellaceae bacterium]|jgi:hypothetical protein|nr:TonB-dependent receptor [Prevotellaceae bacterium]
MKKLSLLLLLLTVQTITIFAQTKISGTVKNQKGTGLASVNISVADSYDGGTTDNNGYYSFNTNEKGQTSLVFSILGYTILEKDIIIAGDTLTVNAVLKEDTQELEAVVVTAGSFEASDKKRAVTVLSTLDVLTTGGANADITASLKTLPGAQQLGDQEGLAVRGGSTYETKQYIDGTLVSKPYYTGQPNVAQRGRFSPTLFKGTVFSTGGYSALYGQALSSALILESVDIPAMSQAGFSLSDVFLGADFQHVANNRKSSWGVSAGYTNLSPYFNMVKQRDYYYTMPEYYNGDANFRIKTKSGGILKYYTTLSSSKIGVELSNIDFDNYKNNMDIKNTNWYNNISLREYLKNGWKMNLGLSYSYNVDKFHQQVYDLNGNPATLLSPVLDSIYNYNIKTRQNFAQAKAVFEKSFTGNNALRFGTEYWHENSRNNYKLYNITLEDNLLAMFAETDVHLMAKLAVKLGARAEYSSVIDRWNIAPRASLAYKTGTYSQVSAAYGMFYQKPENIQLLFASNLHYQQASHYILNYNYSSLGQTMRIEGFYKTYDNLVKTVPNYNNNGSGYARGTEIYWRDKRSFQRFDYWVSYSYVDTKRDYMNYPEKLQPNFAANHTATLVVKSFFIKLKTGFNITYSFASGRPYYNLMKNNGNNNYHIADRGKTRNYNDLGFSLNWLVNWFGSNGVVVASVTNVLGQKQVYGYNYSANGNIKRPIMPTADRFFFIGIFLNWGVDRTQDIIDGRY